MTSPEKTPKLIPGDPDRMCRCGHPMRDHWLQQTECAKCGCEWFREPKEEDAVDVSRCLGNCARCDAYGWMFRRKGQRICGTCYDRMARFDREAAVLVAKLTDLHKAFRSAVVMEHFQRLEIELGDFLAQTESRWLLVKEEEFQALVHDHEEASLLLHRVRVYLVQRLRRGLHG